MEGGEGDDEFVEILATKKECRPPCHVKAYVAAVEPRACGPLVKRLSVEHPLSQPGVDLSHLKRVKRMLKVSEKLTSSKTQGDTRSSATETISASEVAGEGGEDGKPLNKRRKVNGDVVLQVLLGAVSVLDKLLVSDEDDISVVLQGKYSLPPDAVCKINVPGRHPESTAEWNEFQAQWPTTFNAKKSEEFRSTLRKLTADEVQQMKRGMEAALEDAQQTTTCVGTVVMDPISNKIVGQAAPERALQQQQQQQQQQPGRRGANLPKSPLATSILYAIQSISRLERECAVSQGMGSKTFQGGQYLCTGYDVYTTHEPSVFEAMALVHSRIRRLVMGVPSSTGGLTTMNVHELPGTNHKYRVFLCRSEGSLARRCREPGTWINK